MSIETLSVPDLGGAKDVEVIEVCVAAGDELELEQSIVVLETDKATMEVPCAKAGKVTVVHIVEGAKLNEGDALVDIEVAAGDSAESKAEEAVAEPEPVAEEPSPDPAPEVPVEAEVESEVDIIVPDLGGAEDVDVIEVCVAAGDEVAKGDSLIVLETDKASMEVPAEHAGIIVSISVSEGGKVNKDQSIGRMKTSAAAPAIIKVAAGDSVESKAEEAVPEPEPVAEEPSPDPAPEVPVEAEVESEVDIIVPDLGGAEDVDVIEVCVAAGDEVAKGDSLIVLETDKASMEVPAEHAGIIVSISVSEGGKVNKDQSIGRMKTSAAAPAVSVARPEPVAGAPAPETSRSGEAKLAPSPAKIATIEDGPETAFYAGPAVRQLARQLGVELSEVKASGPRGRLSKEDVRNHAKTIIEDVKSGKLSSGAGIPAIPDVDHSQFGPITIEPLSKIAKITAENMSRNWLNVPHVTQFDDADITELEAFRKGMKEEAEKRGSKLTPLPFLIKAVAATLRAEPSFNVSLHSDGENLVPKDYVHIGIAADTPRGLLVPVLRDADKKGLWQIADEVNELIVKARDGKLMPKDMQGACFTISSLGAMGGKGFTPIVNAPQVAIMGVSKASIQPVWDGKEFQPRQMLPLSLSYDHRAINGADCGRFFTHLVATLSDVRRLLL